MNMLNKHEYENKYKTNINRMAKPVWGDWWGWGGGGRELLKDKPDIDNHLNLSIYKLGFSWNVILDWTQWLTQERANSSTHPRFDEPTFISILFFLYYLKTYFSETDSKYTTAFLLGMPVFYRYHWHCISRWRNIWWRNLCTR